MLPYVSDQPITTEQLPSSLFEANALGCGHADGSEIEWSQQGGSAAKRSRQVSVCDLSR